MACANPERGSGLALAREAKRYHRLPLRRVIPYETTRSRCASVDGRARTTSRVPVSS